MTRLASSPATPSEAGLRPTLQMSRRRRHSGLLRVEARNGWLMASPFVFGVLAFWAGPMLYSIFLTTQDWNLLRPAHWVGAGSLRFLLQDELVGISLWNTAYYTFIGVPLRLVLAFALAVALNQNIFGRSFFRTAYYIPSITPAVAAAVIWSQMLSPEFGVVNAFLGWFGIKPLPWLSDPVWAKPAFVLMSLWTVGPTMVIFLAALQNVPVELLEAAHIDGANAWQRFRHVTLAMTSSVTLLTSPWGSSAAFGVRWGFHHDGWWAREFHSVHGSIYLHCCFYYVSCWILCSSFLATVSHYYGRNGYPIPSF